MAFTIGNNGADKEHPPIGTIRGICIGVYDIGWQIGFEGKVEKKVLYLWEVDARLENGEHKGKRHLVSKSYKQSMHEKSAHALMLESWLGKKFSDEERSGYDVEQLINKPCLLALVASKNGQYVNVGAVLPMMAGMEPLQRETPKDYHPEWITKKIEEGKSKPPSANDPVKPSTWTPEVEGPNPATDPIDIKKAALRERYKAILSSKLFIPEEVAMMNAKIQEHKSNVPSMEFLIHGWEVDMEGRKKPSTPENIF